MCVLSQLVFDIGLRKVKLIWCVPEHLTLTSRQDKYLGYCQCHRKLGIMSMLYKAIDLSWRFVLKYLLNSSVRSKGSDAASRGRCIGTGISALLRSPGESCHQPHSKHEFVCEGFWGLLVFIESWVSKSLLSEACCFRKTTYIKVKSGVDEIQGYSYFVFLQNGDLWHLLA